MEDLVAQIPSMAFINAQIIQELHTIPAVQEDMHNVVFRKYGLQDWSLINHAYVASLLYCLVVVPRHAFVNDQVEEAFWDNLVPADQMSSYFDIIAAEPRVRERSSQFLRKLRNSIAHVRFEIVDNGIFVFRDGLPEIDFEAKASFDQLSRFLSEIGARLANLRTLRGREAR